MNATNKQKEFMKQVWLGIWEVFAPYAMGGVNVVRGNKANNRVYLIAVYAQLIRYNLDKVEIDKTAASNILKQLADEQGFFYGGTSKPVNVDKMIETLFYIRSTAPDLMRLDGDYQEEFSLYMRKAADAQTSTIAWAFSGLAHHYFELELDRTTLFVPTSVWQQVGLAIRGKSERGEAVQESIVKRSVEQYQRFKNDSGTYVFGKRILSINDPITFEFEESDFELLPMFHTWVNRNGQTIMTDAMFKRNTGKAGGYISNTRLMNINALNRVQFKGVNDLWTWLNDMLRFNPVCKVSEFDVAIIINFRWFTLSITDMCDGNFEIGLEDEIFNSFRSCQIVKGELGENWVKTLADIVNNNPFYHVIYDGKHSSVGIVKQSPETFHVQYPMKSVLVAAGYRDPVSAELFMSQDSIHNWRFGFSLQDFINSFDTFGEAVAAMWSLPQHLADALTEAVDHESTKQEKILGLMAKQSRIVIGVQLANASKPWVDDRVSLDYGSIKISHKTNFMGNTNRRIGLTVKALLVLDGKVYEADYKTQGAGYLITSVRFLFNSLELKLKENNDE